MSRDRGRGGRGPLRTDGTARRTSGPGPAARARHDGRGGCRVGTHDRTGRPAGVRGTRPTSTCLVPTCTRNHRVAGLRISLSSTAQPSPPHAAARRVVPAAARAPLKMSPVGANSPCYQRVAGVCRLGGWMWHFDVLLVAIVARLHAATDTEERRWLSTYRYSAAVHGNSTTPTARRSLRVCR